MPPLRGLDALNACLLLARDAQPLPVFGRGLLLLLHILEGSRAITRETQHAPLVSSYGTKANRTGETFRWAAVDVDGVPVQAYNSPTCGMDLERLKRLVGISGRGFGLQT